MNTNQAPTCFVIMPFSQSGASGELHTKEYWDHFFVSLQSMIEALGYVCKRSDAAPDSIILNIVENLYSSDVVLAILTDRNFNVGYELGIRQSSEATHGRKRGTILLLQKGQELPSNLVGYGRIEYDQHYVHQIKQELEKYFHDIQAGHYRTPVIETFPTGYQAPVLQLPRNFQLYISGAPGVGKATVTNRLLKELGSNSKNTVQAHEVDFIKDTLRKYIEETDKRLIAALGESAMETFRESEGYNYILKSSYECEREEFNRQNEIILEPLLEAGKVQQEKGIRTIFEGVNLPVKLIFADNSPIARNFRRGKLFVNMHITEQTIHEDRLLEREMDRGVAQQHVVFMGNIRRIDADYYTEVDELVKSGAENVHNINVSFLDIDKVCAKIISWIVEMI
jgi:2-phosphoglycerate kinase